ncbi:hypothetical protein [Roseibium sp. RKSG952]|uniref:hypothetical protein n=1 Tax=Roseibium sp. RKSG952 TaxID=2529384 RepID=UPI0012BD3186|nr:hypothetical protein [Roseibium sp. RKSG952]MTH97015.1 hypothetical protein [Roseibium sp. RKSG952]
MSKYIAAFALAALFLPASDQVARAQSLDTMTGCWTSERFNPSALLHDASDPDSLQITHDKMLLTFKRIDGTDHLVFGYIIEWDRSGTYVLGPIYENGAFNPAGGFLTFGFPEGGLDQVTQTTPDRLLYVHNKSSKLSAFSVRPLKRIDCEAFEVQKEELLRRQKSIK